MKKTALFVAAGILTLFIQSSAQAYYPYSPYAFFQPVDSLPPTGAALGPWRWNFNFGGGPTPLLGSNNQLENGWNFTVGGGYNFTPRFGLDLEFMDSELGVTNTALEQHNQAVNGDATIWSMTLDPIWRFRVGGPVGAYLIGGGGLYERELRFDEPVTFFVPTFHGGFNETGLERVHETDDFGGLNVGAGLTCNLGWGTKLYVEVRYHYIFTSGTATQIIPVTVGFRW